MYSMQPPQYVDAVQHRRCPHTRHRSCFVDAVKSGIKSVDIVVHATLPKGQ
jgi:hypothetical protein